MILELELIDFGLDELGESTDDEGNNNFSFTMCFYRFW